MMYEHWVWPDFLPANVCDKLVESYKDELTPAMVSGSSMYSTAKVSDVRRSNMTWINDREPIVCQKLMEAVSHINHEAFAFDLYPHIKEVQLAQYQADQQGHYDWHIDMAYSQCPSQRKLSLVVQLSDPSDYEGGEFETQTHKFDDAKGKGCLIAIPAFMLHKANPVTKGVRYSMTTWLYGPNFR